MADDGTFTATAEDKFIALNQWWLRNCRDFSLWYLSKTDAQREAALRVVIPDMPAYSASGTATDAILPEMSMESFLASQGRLLVLFLTNRCTSEDAKLSEDRSFLTGINVLD